MFCSNCGNQIADNARFCGVCGAPATSAQPDTQVQQSAPVQQAAPQLRRLYLNTNGLSVLNYKFEIRDEAGALRYTAATVTESMFTYTARLYYPDQSEALTVRQQKKMTFSAMNFDVVAPNGALITPVMQKNKLSKYVYELSNVGIIADGDFFSHNFSFYHGNQLIARVSQKWMSWGDCYELEFADPSLEQLLLGSVLVFELVLIAQRAHRRRTR